MRVFDFAVNMPAKLVKVQIQIPNKNGRYEC